jgi:transposase InsO family protein
VSASCRVLEVSRSGYYDARQRERHPKKSRALSLNLKSIFADSGRSYGSRRLQHALIAKGLRIGRYRVRRLMREHRLFENS